MAWTKILLSGAVVNADINASAAIATSKLSGAITSITGHGTGTAALVNTGLTVGLIPVIGTGGLEADEILVINGAGTELIGAPAKSGFNLALGTIAGTVAEGNHNHSGVYAPVSHALTTHSDVSISAVGAGEVLYYNGGTWANATLVEASIASASHLHTGTYALIAGDVAQNFSTNDLTVTGNLILTGEIQQVAATELLVDDISITMGNGAHSSGALDGGGLIWDTSAVDAQRPGLYYTDGGGLKVKLGEETITGNPELTLMSSSTAASSPFTSRFGHMYYNTTDSAWYIHTP